MTLTALERKLTQAIAGNLIGGNQERAQHVLEHDADLAGCEICTKWRHRLDMQRARARDESERLRPHMENGPKPIPPPDRSRL